ncbi:substrate-binding domain-containing protein [Ensifer canadensis]
MNTTLRALVGSAALALALTSSPALADAAKPNILVIFQTEEGFPFFNPVKAGAEEAAAALGATVNFQYGNGNPERIKSLFQGALAARPDGVALTIIDSNAFDDDICALVKAGIPVVAYNVDDEEAAGGNCRMAFIGQDFVSAGYLIGKRMVEQYGIGKDDLVFTPVDSPDAVYAQLRQKGVDKAMQEVGARTEILGTGFNESDILNAQTQYLIGNPNVKAIIGIGLPQVEMAVRAAETTGRTIPIGGFDLSQTIVDGIKSDKITATVDQQPYTQGFYSVSQLVHYIRYGLYPSDMKTGGNGLVDKTNYQNAEANLGTRR